MHENVCTWCWYKWLHRRRHVVALVVCTLKIYVWLISFGNLNHIIRDSPTVTLFVWMLVLDSRIILKQIQSWCSRFSCCHALCLDACFRQLTHFEKTQKNNKLAFKNSFWYSRFSYCHALCFDTNFRQPNNSEATSKSISFEILILMFRTFQQSRFMFGC